MNISQLQVAFVPEHDRLLFRVSTSDSAEVRAWLTRRMIKLLWPSLMDAINRLVAKEKPAAAPQAREMIAEMKREASLKDSDFSKPFQPQAASYPLGEEPILVSNVDLQPLDGGQMRVSFRPASGQGVDIAMGEQLLHAFCKLLQQGCAQAEWDIRLVFPGEQPATPAAEAEAEAPGDRPKYLN
jgi:hypothetical protein